MQLLYYSKKKMPNFGDDLNGYIWKQLAPQLFHVPNDASRAFLGIGTIIGIDPENYTKITVFTSGIGYNTLEKWKSLTSVDYAAVRGPLTAKIVGVADSAVLTDGAILTPLVQPFPRKSSPQGNVIVIPHWESIADQSWSKACKMCGFDLIDPRQDPVNVISQIARARLVLTESLHGAILSDTYDVPWVAFASTKNFSFFKWLDWGLSVGVLPIVHSIRSPSLSPVLDYGRPLGPVGSTYTPEPEKALRLYYQKMQGTSVKRSVTTKIKLDLVMNAKKAVHNLTVIHPVFGYCPERTAEDLNGLASLQGQLSKASKRAELQDRLIDILKTIS